MHKLIKEQRSQAAFEHLIVVAWVLLLFGLIIFAIIYLGILDVDNFIPDKMDMGGGLPVKDMIVDENEIVFIFKSDMGKTLYDFRVNVSQCNDGNGAMSEPMMVPEGKIMKVRVDCPNAIAVGEKFKSDFDVFYSTKTGGDLFEHKTTGDMIVEVAEDTVLGITEAKVVTVSKCTELTESNVIYRLNQSLYGISGKCFNITDTDDVVFDLNGNEIVHEAGIAEGVAVWILNRQNITITNGEIYGFGVAVMIENSDNSTITDIKASSNAYGIQVISDSDDNEITNNELCGNLIKDFRCDGTGNYGSGNTFRIVDNCSDENVDYDMCPIILCSTPGDGSGTSFEDPYIICNCKELQSITTTGLDLFYELSNDIDCSGTSAPGHLLNNNGYGFNSIGTGANRFTGGLEGAGYTISDLYINNISSYRGLFGYADGAVIQNLTFVDPVITGDSSMTGLLIGRGDNVMITNVIVKDANINGYRWVGGLVGYLDDSIIGQIRVDNVNINGSAYIGGLFGQAVDTDVSEAFVNGSIKGSGGDVAGFVGFMLRTDITDSAADYVNVSGKSYIGGMVGFSSQSSITGSYATGSIDGNSSVGGLIGYGKDANVSNSYFKGNAASFDSMVGGIIGKGETSIILSSYSIGIVSAYDFAGGLIGNSLGDLINNSFSTTRVNVNTGSENAGAIIGYGDNADVQNTYWYDIPDDADKCLGVGAEPATCYNETNNVNYYFDSGNLPLNTWNQGWAFPGNDFPQVDSDSIVSSSLITLNGCARLTNPDTTYRLTKYLNNEDIQVKANNACFSIEAENITLDCDGYYINGNNVDHVHAIYSDQDYTTIKNCEITISNSSCKSISVCYDSIFITSADNVTIIGNNLHDSYTSMQLYAVNYSIVFNNTISGGKWNKNFLMFYSSNNIIEGNSIKDSGSISLYMEHSDNNVFINNVVNNSGYHGMYFSNSDYNNLTGNNITSTSEDGIFLFNSLSSRLKNNIICIYGGDNVDGSDYIDDSGNFMVKTFCP